MTAKENLTEQSGRRVAAIVLRVLAVLGGIGVCCWVALWLAFAL